MNPRDFYTRKFFPLLIARSNGWDICAQEKPGVNGQALCAAFPVAGDRQPHGWGTIDDVRRAIKRGEIEPVSIDSLLTDLNE